MSGTDSTSTTAATDAQNLTTIAAIDIGSNSVKMTIARRLPDGTIRDIGWRSEVVRLGAGIDQTGRLAEDRIEVAIVVLRQFADEARAMGAARIIAVATEATRAAANGEDFLDRVRQETGISVSVIGGDREAELSFRGLTTQVDVSGHVVIADIGGGSTELIYALDGTMLRAGSVAVGSGRLTDRHVVTDPPGASELVACHDDSLALLQPLYRELPVPRNAALRLILVGGTGEYLGRMVPHRLTIKGVDVARVLVRMQLLPAAELAAELSIPEARARVLPAGIAMVTALIKLTSPAAIAVGQSGLRAGLLLEAFEELDPAMTESLKP